jgi:hypothetical protein
MVDLGNMDERPDYILDLSSQSAGQPEAADPASSLKGRAWIAVHWRCCNVYNRLYKNAAGTAYTGRCPRCGKSATANVGAGGTDQRFFTAG